MIGQTISQYRVVEKLGEGGMGEVYRARDTKLNRDVALKVLPPAFAADPDRLARFKREAQVLASLNHPHIAAIYGFEDSGSTHALVLELVEGPTLADRIAHGPIPVDEALPIARQIAEALEAAHERGIIHRDLKPANIKLGDNGIVKVLDFGLAKALEPTSEVSPAVTAAPTITTPAMTRVGMILGTAAYMSPEQTKGKRADRRSDIWAFGCVLFEMLAGRRAFDGEGVTDTLAVVLTKDPDWSALPHTPPAIRRLLHRCLQRDPVRRLQHVGDARVEIDEVANDQRDITPARREHFLWTDALPWAIAVILAAALAAAWLKPRSAPLDPGSTTRLELGLPEGVEFLSQTSPGFGISTDGTRVAFSGTRDNRQLFVRRLDEPQAVPVRGVIPTGSCCWFAPDGEALAFIQSDHTLKKLTLADGLFVTLATEVDYTAGATWTADGRIIFIRDHALWQVPSSGGQPQPLLTLAREKDEVAHAWPAAIAGGQAILFTSMTGNRRDAHIEALSLANGVRHVLLSGTFPLYGSSGHLVFFRDGALFAVPFDAQRFTVTGTPVRVVDDIGVAAFGGPLVAISGTGALLYASSGTLKSRLTWVTRQGLEEPVTDVERDYWTPRLAPDGRRIAVSSGGQLWVFDTERATSTRITSDETTAAGFPVWTPDGRRVVFYTPLNGLQWVETDGAGHAHSIPDTTGNDFPTSISPAGDSLAFIRQSPETSGDFYLLSLHGDPKPKAVVRTTAYEGGAEFSPDGRWFAYASDDSGQMQVYVRPVTGSDQRWPVSTQGGRSPKWSRSGRELFYRNGPKMMMVEVITRPDLKLSAPKLLFEHPYQFGTTMTASNYDVSLDGLRLLMVKGGAGAAHVNIVLNWFDELKRRVPVK